MKHLVADEVLEDLGVALTTGPATSVNKPVISPGTAPATERRAAGLFWKKYDHSHVYIRFWK